MTAIPDTIFSFAKVRYLLPLHTYPMVLPLQNYNFQMKKYDISYTFEPLIGYMLLITIYNLSKTRREITTFYLQID